jgi:hypothetical protein
MADISLKSYLLYSILAIFLLMSAFYSIKGFNDVNQGTLADDYAVTQFEAYEEIITSEKNKTEKLYDDTVQVSPDTETEDLLGSWLTQGWGKLKDLLSSSVKLTQFSYDLVDDFSKKVGLPPFMVTIAIFTLVIILLIIVLSVIIQRQGIK